MENEISICGCGGYLTGNEDGWDDPSGSRRPSKRMVRIFTGAGMAQRSQKTAKAASSTSPLGGVIVMLALQIRLSLLEKGEGL